MIAYLAGFGGIATDSIPVVPWATSGDDAVYPSIMVNATAYGNPEFGKNILLANNILLNIGAFTTIKDDDGDDIEKVMGFIREAIVQDDIEAALNAEQAGLFVYTNGVMIKDNVPGSDNDHIRMRGINLEIACTIQDDGS